MTAELAPNALLREVMEVLITKGAEGFRPMLEVLLNEAMKIDRHLHLGVGLYERLGQRRGHAPERLNREIKRRTRVVSCFQTKRVA